MAEGANIAYQKNIELTRGVAKAHAELATQLQQNIATNAVIIAQQKELSTLLSSARGAKEYAIAQKAIENNIKAVALQEKELIKTESLRAKEQEKLTREVLKTEQAQKKAVTQTTKLTQAQKQLAAATTAQRGSIAQLNAVTAILTARRTALGNITTSNKAKYDALTSAISRNVAKQKELGAVVGRNQLEVGNYQKSLSGLAGSLAGSAGITLGVAGAVQALRKLIGINVEFERSMSKVQAVSGASNAEFAELRAQALYLGASTEKTASDVSKLQVELSKLGFDPKQIQLSTASILDLATAAGEELPAAAEIAASTLKQFDIPASQTQKVTDIMAKSFSSSALDMNKFSTAMATVGPVARNAGHSIEKTTAFLSVLSDRGLDASTQGTSLRKIFLDLSASGQTLDEALEQIATSTNKNNEAQKLFGIRAATAAVILAENRSQTDRLTYSYQNSAGAASNMAKVMRDNLAGDVDKATSALEGLTLGVGGALMPLIRSAIQGFTDFINIIGGIVSVFGAMTRAISDSNTEIDSTVESLMSITDQYSSTEELLASGVEAREKFVDALLAEGRSYEEAKSEADKYLKTLELLADPRKLKKANLELEESLLKLRITESELAGDTGLLYTLNSKLADVQSELTFVLEKLNEKTRDELTIIKDSLESRLMLNDSEKKRLDRVNELLKVIDEEESAAIGLIAAQEVLLDQAKLMPEFTEKEITAKNILIESINEEIKRLKQLGIEKEKANKEKVPTKIKDIKLSGDDQFKREAELFEAANDAEIQAYVDKEVAKTEALKAEEAKREEIRKTFTNIALDSIASAASTYFDIQQAKREEETQAELLAFDERLNNEVLDDEQRKEIEKDKTAREKVLRKENAEANKKDSLFNIAVNTLVGISKTIATLGLPAGAIPAAAVAAGGLVQAALVAARPIPAFDDGTDSTPGGGFLAGEKRPEFMKHKGRVTLVDKPTLFGDEYKGAKIWGGAESAKIMDKITHQEVINSVSNVSSDIQGQMIAAAVEKSFANHSSRMINEMKLNRPKKQTGLDQMKRTNDIIKRFAE